jgi:hypothetical protein
VKNMTTSCSDDRDPGPEGIVAVKGAKNTAVTPGIPYQNRICEHPDVLV